MKKLFVVMAMIATMFTSCDKDDGPAENTGKITIDGVVQSIVDAEYNTNGNTERYLNLYSDDFAVFVIFNKNLLDKKITNATHPIEDKFVVHLSRDISSDRTQVKHLETKDQCPIIYLDKSKTQVSEENFEVTIKFNYDTSFVDIDIKFENASVSYKGFATNNGPT